jgi:hypothetical protein
MSRNLVNIGRAVSNICGWHHARNLIEGSTDLAQFAKLVQESGELSDNLCKGKGISDDIGDMVVVILNMATRHRLSSTITAALTCEPLDIHADHNDIEAFAYLSILMGELAHSLLDKDLNIKTLVEITVLLVYIANAHELTIMQCLDQAWDDIKDRKGEMRNGVFIKEADL